MFAPTTEVSDHLGNRVAVSHVVRGANLMARVAGRICASTVRKVGAVIDPVSVTLVVASGRRLAVAGRQGVFSRKGKEQPRWRMAVKLEVGDLLYTVDDGILTVDRLVCTVHSSKPGEPWTTISSNKGSVFAEEILCRAS